MSTFYASDQLGRRNTELTLLVLQVFDRLTDEERSALRAALEAQSDATLALISAAVSIDDLRAAARDAADWLCEAPVGTDQHERGLQLRAAIEQVEGGGA